MEDNIILYDWLSFTTKDFDAHGVTELLGLQDISWEVTKGARGYRDRLYFNCISIHYNGRDDMGVWCELSGQGCRAFETLTTLPEKWQDLFKTITYHQMNITRLDVAYDDHSGLLDINQIIQDTRNKEYVSRSDSWEIIESNKGQSLIFGSMKSDILIRIYDKAMERSCPEGEHWIRCELQLRRERAKAFTEIPLSIGQSFCGVMVNYLRFVDPTGDSNRWRWPMKSYWGEFLCSAEAIRLYREPGLEYNFLRCENFVINQAGNAIDAYIKMRGVEGFLETLHKRSTLPNPKYERLVQEYRALWL